MMAKLIASVLKPTAIETWSFFVILFLILRYYREFDKSYWKMYMMYISTENIITVIL